MAGLFKSKLKNELLKYIGPKASKKVQDKTNIKEIRDEIFALLIKHGYLVENHPKSAGGSESLRTSYSVGSQYQKSLEDYINTKQDSLSDSTIRVNHVNSSNILSTFQEEIKTDIIDREKLNEIYWKQTSEMLWALFLMYESNIEKKYEKALDIGKNLIINYLRNLHESYLKIDNASMPEFESPEFFFDYLAKNALFPLTMEKIKAYYKESKHIISSENEFEKKAMDLYELLSNLCSRLQSKIK